MSELHTYRIEFREAAHRRAVTVDIKAFTATEAIVQFRAAHPWDGPMCPLNVEPLPDSHPARVTIPIGGLNAPEPPEFGIARSATPEDRTEALEAALRERTAERDAVRRVADLLVVERDKLRNVIGDRDALQKRIEDALGWARGRETADVDQVADLIARLEGRAK